jgi:hypothetical protein
VRSKVDRRQLDLGEQLDELGLDRRKVLDLESIL